MKRSCCPECHAPIVWLQAKINPKYEVMIDAASADGNLLFDSTVHQGHLSRCPFVRQRCNVCGQFADGQVLKLEWNQKARRYIHESFGYLCTQHAQQHHPIDQRPYIPNGAGFYVFHVEKRE